MLQKKEAKLEQLQRGPAEWRLVYQQLQPCRRPFTRLAERNLGFTALQLFLQDSKDMVGIS